MTSLDDLFWLYNMALDFNLEPEKEWLKQQIEEQMQKNKSQATLEPSTQDLI